MFLLQQIIEISTPLRYMIIRVLYCFFAMTVYSGLDDEHLRVLYFIGGIGLFLNLLFSE